MTNSSSVTPPDTGELSSFDLSAAPRQDSDLGRQYYYVESADAVAQVTPSDSSRIL